MRRRCEDCTFAWIERWQHRKNRQHRQERVRRLPVRTQREGPLHRFRARVLPIDREENVTEERFRHVRTDVVARSHDEHRGCRGVHYAFGDAPEPCMAEAAPTVRRHHEQIRSAIDGVLHQ